MILDILLLVRLKRECMEELGVEIAVGGLFAETKYVYEDLSVHLYFFKAEIMRGEIKMLEHCEMRFVQAEDLKKLDFCPADAEVVKLLSCGK